jgi:hypothetical protein
VSLRAVKPARGKQTSPWSSAKNARKRAKEREIRSRCVDFQHPARHYIKLSPVLEEYVRHIAPAVGDWQSAVIRDVTENGLSLVIESLQPNDQGIRIGLCGEKFYCEAGPDRDRDDCLFVFKVADASRRTPKSVPRRYAAKVYPFEWRHSEQLDTTADLWKAEILGDASSAPNSVEAVRVDVGPSEQLLRILSTISPVARKGWQPGIRVEAPDDPEEFLKLVRRPWAKFKLERYARLTARQESLIKGLLPNASFGRQERLRLVSIFDLNLLNAVVLHSQEGKDWGGPPG